MRNQRRRRNTTKQNNKRELLTAVPIILVLTFLCGNYCSTALAKTAVMSAGFMMPQAAVGTFKKTLSKSSENTSTVGNTVQYSEVAAVTDSHVVPAVSTSSNATNDEIPADITAMMNEAAVQFASASHDGAVVEKQWDSSSATSTFENVTVRNTTPSHSINIEDSLSKPATINITDKTQPTVLIFHTHTTECYLLTDNDWYTKDFPSRCTDPSRNMVRVGDAICGELEKAGIGYIHDTEIHDSAYTGAYDRSRETILKIMEENPSIQIVLDVHRDAIEQSDGTRLKPTVTINGRKAAQIMIIAGCEDGKVASFPTWEENLTFALKLDKTAETLYPGLMRPILFSARKYNMDVTPCSVLLEFGSDSNTIAEAEYSGHLMGRAIAEFVNENS